jgi:hypothetical protein
VEHVSSNTMSVTGYNSIQNQPDNIDFSKIQPPRSPNPANQSPVSQEIQPIEEEEKLEESQQPAAH